MVELELNNEITVLHINSDEYKSKILKIAGRQVLGVQLHDPI